MAENALYCPHCGRPKLRDLDSDALLGTLLGDRFQVQARIGHGGSGAVYRAEHVTLRRKVAVKVLHKELSHDELAVERFRREATTVTEIDNDHIVEIYDFGRTRDGRLYLAMELLEGETLDALLARERTLPVSQVADILIQVGSALVEAHAIGYVHRDVRPRNIYLAVRHGQPAFIKLLDFGLAKLVEPDAHVSSTNLGMTFGDPRYMSPEQARGDRVDRRSDLYQLGCVAYEMLTGAPPFVGDRVLAILTKQVNEIPEPLPTRRPDAPLWIEAACAKLLAKDPDNRFATATRMIDALQRGLQTGEVMSDEDARRYDPSPAAAVSRLVERMGAEESVVAIESDRDNAGAARGRAGAPELGTSAEVETTPAEFSQSGASARWYQEGERAYADAEHAVHVDSGSQAIRTITPSSSQMTRWDMPAKRGRSVLITLAGVAAIAGGIAVAFTRLGSGTPQRDHSMAAPSAPAPPDVAPQVRLDAPIDATESDRAASAAAAPSLDASTVPAIAGSSLPAPEKPLPSAPKSVPANRSLRSVPVRRQPVVPTAPAVPTLAAPAPPLSTAPIPPPAPPVAQPTEPSDVGIGAGSSGPADPYETSAHPAGNTLQERQAAEFTNLGQKAMRRGQFRDAIAHFRRAVSLAPNSSAFTFLGDAHLSAAHFPQAAENFKRALQLDPDNDHARSGYEAASSRISPPTDE